MNEMFGSVRRSLVFRNSDAGDPGTLVDKINSRIRKSRVFSKASSLLPSPPKGNDEQTRAIRWRRGELIGCGAFGHVYMGMNLDSGELLAVKQVLIAANRNTQVHIRELEEEIKLLKNLTHPNIVRYIGTVREEESLNILLEFVSGGSISSLLGKFGPFPEAVIRTYTKQLLLGLDYLHKNGIMHRDIKGANILVDNKGCIKLADFGASKQVVELANGSGAKSMKGTPYWMAPEVILQTGHSFSADIWSVGCTIIEMATGKPPWVEHYQELGPFFFHIGTTKSHPPIPDQLSPEAQDLLLKCLHKDPELRPSASDLMQHPFVTGKSQQHSTVGTPTMENIEAPSVSCPRVLDHSPDADDLCNMGTLNLFTVNSGKCNAWGAENNDNDMCQLDGDDFMEDGGLKLRSVPLLIDFKSFNPVEEPSGDDTYQLQGQAALIQSPSDSCTSFQFGRSLSEDDEVLTESKISAFLDEKALELKKLQTPLYEEFYNSLVPSCLLIDNTEKGSSPNYLKLPPKSRSPLGKAVDAVNNVSPGSGSRRTSSVSGEENIPSPMDVSSPQCSDITGPDTPQKACSPGVNDPEVRRKWKEELDRELERQREMKRQVGVGGKTASPIDRGSNRHRDKSRFASPGK